jgi:SAM-dependent methyltransferase
VNPKALLSHSSLYSLFQNLIGARTFRQMLASDYVRGKAGDRVLDIGCGTGDILEYLPGLDYHGFDTSPEYIERASRKYGAGARFVCDNVLTARIEPASFDVVLAIGILHHLSDEEARKLLRLAESALKPGGRFITMDGCYAETQSPIARFLISKDRGEYMRDERSYRALASSVFADVQASLREDLLRVPYTLLIMEMTKPGTRR